jgi:hypothetical protein
MKATTTSETRHHRLREAYRKQIANLGVFVEGALCEVKRPGRQRPAWQLTFKQAGKTRTVYVPVELVPEVQRWAREFKRLKQLVRKITRQNLAIIRRHVAVRRAASRARLRSTKRSARSSAASSAIASRG